MRQRIWSGAARVIALWALATTACDGGDEAGRSAAPDSGTSTGGSGAGGSSAGGNGAAAGDAGSSGAATGGSGAAAGSTGAGGNSDAAGGATSGGAAGTTGDSGADGASPRCNSCWLLREGATWDANRLFFADGQRVIWQEGGNANDPIATVNIDGSNPQSFPVTGCQVIWSNPTMFGGYVYFNNISRVPMGFGPGSSCEPVYTVPTTLNARAYPYFLDTFANVFWVNVYEHDMYRLVRIDMSRFRVTDELNPSGLRVRAADASFLYGYDNPGQGSGSYRLLRYDRATKLTTVLAVRIVGPDMVHVDATSLYFASNGELYKIPKDTNVEVTPTAIPGPLDAWRILVDGTDVVYFKYGDTQFHRMPLAGGPVTTWSTGAFLMRGITWDTERYFVMVSPPDRTSTHNLVRIPK
jgi:hypothetical protein